MWMTESAIKLFCSRLTPFQNSDACPMYQMDFVSLKKFAKGFENLFVIALPFVSEVK